MEPFKFKEVGECVRVCDNLYFERSSEFLVNIPTKSKKGDAGWDFYVPEYKIDFPNPMPINSTFINQYIIPAKSWLKIQLGVRSHFPKGYVLQINDRSGLSSNEGLFVIGCVIDSGYTGEITCTLCNFSDKPYQIEPNQKICQGLLLECDTEKYDTPIMVDKFYISSMKTERGNLGFGSSGK